MTKRVRQSRHGSLRKQRKQEPEDPDAAAELPTPETTSDPDSQNCEDDKIATHPRSFDHHHVARLQEFTNDLHQALRGSSPPRTCPYTAVHVLLLRWDEDDLGVHKEISRLRRVFQDQFRFEVEEWNIPTLDPYHSLQDKIFHLQKSHQTPSDLLIVYYGGHSDPDTRRGRSIWHANLSTTSPSLEWFNIQPILLTAKPHVLMILDCCFAANAARDTTEGSSKELLAACGRENPTVGVCMRSFTSVLIEELQSFEGAAFTVAMLHARLITLRHKLAYTPIYAALAEKGGNSIVISPLPKIPSPSPQGSESQTGPGSETGITPPVTPSSVSLNESTRVLLAVSVAEDVAHNVAQWVSWLTTAAPWDVSKVDVRLECMYKSHSTLLLVSVPIVGWSRLPESAAYRFIGFIKSGNLVCETTKPGPTAEKHQQPVSEDVLSSKGSIDERIKGDAFTKDAFAKNLLTKDLFTKDLFPKDLFTKDLFTKDLFPKSIFITKDASTNTDHRDPYPPATTTSVAPKPKSRLSQTGAFASQAVPSTSPGETPRKKRRRPSKEAFDKRVAEAAQRGEVYPPPRECKPSKPSTDNIVNDAPPQTLHVVDALSADAVVKE